MVSETDVDQAIVDTDQAAEEKAVNTDQEAVEYPFIAATPDGLVSTTHVVEAKCPYSGQHAMTEPGLSLPFLELQHGRLTMKRCHKYFEQVQCQMAVTKQARAYFVVFTFIDV